MIDNPPHPGIQLPPALGERLGAAAQWLRSTRWGLILMALVVGLGAGGGAVVFRLMIFGFTRLFTGYSNYGQNGHAPSLHLPQLGIWFVLVTPILAGVVFGPLIYFFAREARGHGVPEVMLATAENGGRIRPQVTVVKALASALCIGGGGSVGREGPIVQIGSAFGSSLGQLIRMSEGRLRLLVACGAAGGISGTFNAPITGTFFGLELFMQEISLETTAMVLLSSATADVIARLAFGSSALFQLPAVHFGNEIDYLLCPVLGLLAGLAGVGFKTILYGAEDVFDRIWRGKPEWLRPAALGIILGVILLAIPQLYGVGYPVIERALSGHYVLWFLVVLVVGKIVAASVTIGIGGSGGVFAPSLFIGAALGTGYGIVVHAIFGSATGSPEVYGMLAMGAVFGAAARAPLTAIASGFEMTGDHNIVLGLMITVVVATALSRRLSYGTIYTTKLLRRGIDIERPRPATLWQQLRVRDAMSSVPEGVAGTRALDEVLAALAPALPAQPAGESRGADGGRGAPAPRGRPAAQQENPHALFSDETLEQALRQLLMYGRAGLPVLGENGESVIGWVTNQDVLRAFARSLGQSVRQAPAGAQAAEWATESPGERAREPHNPLRGYSLLSLDIRTEDSAAHREVRQIPWPPASLVVAIRHKGTSTPPTGTTRLEPGDRVTVLVPAALSDSVEKLVRGPADGAPDPQSEGG